MNQTQNSHIVSAYGAELEQLIDDLLRMGGLVETQLSVTLQAFIRRDLSVLPEVREREAKVNQLNDDIDKRVIRLFALRQPVATDLRVTISSMKIASDLERMGDLAKNIAFRAEDMKDFPPMSVLGQLERLGAIVAKQLHDGLESLARQDAATAIRVWRTDDEVDEHYNAVTREVLMSMTQSPQYVEPGVPVLFVSKNLERLGDHVTNIAESVHFMATGEPLEDSDTLKA